MFKKRKKNLHSAEQYIDTFSPGDFLYSTHKILVIIVILPSVQIHNVLIMGYSQPYQNNSAK